MRPLGAEHRCAADQQAASPPCTLPASQTIEGGFTEPGPAVTGYGAREASIAVMDTEQSTDHVADVSQWPSMGRRGMPAASSANISAMPDAGANQDSASSGSAISDPHRERLQLSEPLPAGLACLPSQHRHPELEAHSTEAAQIGKGVSVPLMGNLPQAALFTDEVQPEATLLGVGFSMSTLAQDAALLQTEEQALSQLSTVTAGFYASTTSEDTKSAGAAEQAPMASRDRQVPEHNSAGAARNQVSAFPASAEALQTEQQAPGQDTQEAEESFAKASGGTLDPAVPEAAAAAVTVSAADAQLPPDNQLSRTTAQDGKVHLTLEDASSGGASIKDWERHSTPLQVRRVSTPEVLLAGVA